MSCWSGGRRALISRSSIGMMPLSGVRISWLIVARNSPLAIIAASAACLASVSSRSRRRCVASPSCSAFISFCAAPVRSVDQRLELVAHVLRHVAGGVLAGGLDDAERQLLEQRLGLGAGLELAEAELRALLDHGLAGLAHRRGVQRGVGEGQLD